jgi:hypothetical protein
LTVVGRDLFHALELLREELEPAGWLVAVQGSRANAYASGMMRDMNGARRVYLWEFGRHVQRSDLVDIFAAADPSDVVTLADQRENYARWRASTRDVRSSGP